MGRRCAAAALSSRVCRAGGHRRQQQQQQGPPGRLLLPEFPRVRELLLPAGSDAEPLAGFVAMYRGHCQRLLDECAQPHELAGVLQCVAHFWRRVPAHLAPLLASNALANLVGVCDGLLYGAVADALLPTYAPPPHDRCVYRLRGSARCSQRGLPLEK